MFGYPKIQYEGYRENASNSIEDGRGNLRAAKMICTPTVGIGGDTIAVQMSSHRRRHAHTVHPACHPPMGTYNLYHDAAHRVVTLPFAVPVDAHVVANGGRRHTSQRNPRKRRL